MTRPAHLPVLGPEAVALLQPREGGIYVDATFGAGGYSRLILKSAHCRVIGIDRDRDAIAGGAALVEQSAGRLELVEDRFSNLEAICAACGTARIDGVVMDIGVSSMQFDQAARGFSFRFDGPLDMRMGGAGPDAADVLAQLSEADLARVIYVLGEERRSRSLARAIVTERAQKPIVTTKALADLVSRVVHARPGDIHPATRTFQALRIFVNDELNELAQALGAAERLLKPGGRLAVVSFHSLEDRLVKTFFAARAGTQGGSRHAPQSTPPAPSFELLTRRAIVAGEAEVLANPRARSARLRAGLRTEHPPLGDAAILVGELPALSSIRHGD